MTMAGEGTRLENLNQPPLNTTLMAVLKGAADYHGLGLSEPEVYGLTGHAFLINIHRQICPSGPYCWNRAPMQPLIENMGLRMTDLGFYGTGAAEEARAAVERKLLDALDEGIPCSLLNMENQLIYGYDGTGFLTAQPWAPHCTFPPATLSFGSWREFGDTFHASFYTIEKARPLDRRDAVAASLDYAVDLWKSPEKHTSEAYGAGPKAYDNWIAAVPESGADHGHWWNATVWSECRRMAADYCASLGAEASDVAGLCIKLRDSYRSIAEALGKASDKAMASDEKVALLEETRQREIEAIGKVEQLAEALRPASRTSA